MLPCKRTFLAVCEQCHVLITHIHFKSKKMFFICKSRVQNIKIPFFHWNSCSFLPRKEKGNHTLPTPSDINQVIYGWIYSDHKFFTR